MSSDFDRRLGIFTEALQLPARDRASFLDRACGGDEALRRKVEALLKANERAGDFLEDQPPALPPPEDGTRPPDGKQSF